jgi:predicted secreted hydrolase
VFNKLSAGCLFAAFLLTVCHVATLCRENPVTRADWKHEGYRAGLARFPEDEGSHPGNKMEWFYCNMHLTSDDGRHFSLWVAYYVSFNARFIAFSDEDAGSFISEVVPGSTVSKPGGRDLRHASSYGTDRWKQVSGKPFIYDIRLKFKDITLNATMDALKPPLPLELDARADYKEKEFSYYYSLPRTAVTGVLEIGGVKHNINGIAWEDHQWGDFSLTGINLGIGHEWFSIQLNTPEGKNPVEVITYQLFTPEYRIILPVFTLMWPDGSLYDTKDFIIERLGFYNHEGEYLAAKWRVTEPRHKIDITLTPTTDNQMLFPPMFKPFREGACRAEGSIGGVAYSGTCFAEGFKRYYKPALEIISPAEGNSLKYSSIIRWRGATDEALTMTYALEYSADGGSTFKLLADNLRTDHFDWDLSDLPEGDRYIVKVTGKSLDGTFKTTAVSGGMFSVAH